MQTSRLFLKPFAEEDAAFLIELYNTPKFLKFVGDRNLHKEGDAVKFIQDKMISQMEKMGFGNYVIINKESGEKMGGIGIFVRENIEVADIGFSLLPKYEGNGFVFEAATFLLKNAKENIGLKKVSAITVEKNIASRNLIEKLGLVFLKKIKLTDDAEELMYYEKSLI